MTADPSARQTSGLTMALIVRYVRAQGGDAALLSVLKLAGEKRSPRELEDETRWSTYAEKVALFEAAAEVLGDPHVARHIGEGVVEQGIAPGLKMIMRSLGSPSRVLRSLPKVSAKFSSVADMKAKVAGETRAIVTYQVREPATPHRMDCDYTRGLLASVTEIFGLPPARVSHAKCQVDGAECCVYEVTWQSHKRRRSSSKVRIRDLEEQLKSLREHTEAFSSMTLALTSPSDVDDALANIAQRAFHAATAEAYCLVVSTGGERKILYEGIDPDVAERMAIAFEFGKTFEPGFPVIVSEIRSERRAYGTLALMNPAGGGFFDFDRDLLDVYARHAAVALDVAEALEEARLQKETSVIMLDAARSLMQAVGNEDLCHKLALAIPTLMGVGRSLVFLWSEEVGALILRASYGFTEETGRVLKDFVVRPENTPVLKLALESRVPRIHVRESADPYIAAQLDSFGAGATASTTLFVEGKPVAVITAVADEQGFDLEDDILRERLLGLSEQGTRAFENVVLSDRQNERADRLKGQKEILEMVARGADLREILDTLCVTIEQQIDGAMCAILLMDTEEESLQAVSCPSLPAGFSWAISGVKPGPFARSAGTAVFREHAVFVADIEHDPLWDDARGKALEHGVVAAWATPMFASNGNRILGALTLYLNRKGSPSEHEREFMEMGAQLSAITIERKGLEQQLTHQAFHDSLTGLPNRALFSDRVQHALDRISRHDESIAVLFVDLDNFKSINDSLGHQAGDELLKIVAHRLTGCLRAADTAARLGGDEFAILIEGADKRSAMNVADRILEALQVPILLSGMEIRAPGSIGMAFSEDGSARMSDLLRNADTAMYAAKEAGRNRIEIFEQRMHSGIMKRLELQAELQRAVDADEMVVHYQPIYKLDPHAMVGVEALVRWQHPTRGLLGPIDFIPMAEETGLIVPIGNMVLETTCEQLKAWSDAGRGMPLRAGVNFSAKQLQSPTLVEDIASCLARFSVDPELLIVEITESVLMHDPDEIAEKLQELRAIGVSVAIDDFGTGYSSLSYLRRFPVNILKIDKFFVQGLDRGPEESAYGRAIVRLSQSLGLDVVAEGIETAGEFETLLEMGCDFGQGFLFSKACPPDTIASLPGFAPKLLKGTL